MTYKTKTVLITGCSSGIGLATAKYFQEKGWNVAATMRNPADQPELARLPNVITPALDVNDKASIAAALQTTLDAFGKIDVLVNNAGYALMGAFETLDEEQIRRQFDTNVFGLMEVCRAVLPHFRQRREGLLINVASMVGRVPLPLYSVYNASKHAVEGFTEGLVYELEPFGVRVKIIEPGAVNTNFFGRSSDRANATGESAYSDYSSEQLGVMDDIGPGGSRPVDAAKVIWGAANDSSRRLRYSVGIDARALLTARRLLPETLFRDMIKMSLSRASYNSLGQYIYRPKS
jgi:NAD(P)-dependent dehydrogenase (short-subunit alcohol dehydrogenase family)